MLLRYPLFEVEIVKDEFSFVGACFHGGFIHILDIMG